MGVKGGWGKWSSRIGGAYVCTSLFVGEARETRRFPRCGVSFRGDYVVA